VSLPLALTLVGFGFAGAFFSGLLGVGGAIVLIPLLLYGPPLLGVGDLGIHAVTGVTMAQVFVATLTGVLAHHRQHAVNADLVWVGGLSMAAGALVGAVASRHLPEIWLVLTFALMATAAAVLMLIPLQGVEPPVPGEPLRVSRLRLIPTTAGVGLAAGLVGAGGAFLLVPLLLVVLRVPLRVTIGSSLGIAAFGATGGFLGKLVTGQIPLGAALAVTLGAAPGAVAGAAVSRRVRETRLRWILAAVISLSAARAWWDVFSR